MKRKKLEEADIWGAQQPSPVRPNKGGAGKCIPGRRRSSRKETGECLMGFRSNLIGR